MLPLYEKISCLLVTGGHSDCWKQAIHCYCMQTYRHKELIIVCQGPSAQINDYITSLHRTDIQFVWCAPRLSLGAMRNLTLELATGEVACQWQEDDLSHPLRLVTQYKSLLANRNVASCYTQHLNYDAATSELYWIDWDVEGYELFQRYLPNTIMFRNSLFHDSGNILYSEAVQSRREVDLDLVQRILQHGSIASIKEGNQYCYLDQHNSVLDKKVYSVNQLLSKKKLILETLVYYGMDRPVQVRSLDGVAFEYKIGKELDGFLASHADS